MSRDAEMERPLRHSGYVLRIEQEGPSHNGNGSAGENTSPAVAKSESDRIKVFYQTVLSAIVVFIVAALSGYKDMKPLYSTTNHKKVHLSSLVVVEGLCMIATFMCAVVLMMYEFYTYDRQGHRRCRILTVLVAVTGAMLVATDTVLVAITNRGNAVLAVLFVPVVMLVGAAVHTGALVEELSSQQPSSTQQPSTTQQPSSPQDGGYEAAAKSAFDLATVGTMAAFALQGTIAFGYLKTPEKKGKREPPLDLAVCYAASTVSLIVMAACAMPLALLPGEKLKVLAGIIGRLRHVLLASLALMALVISVEFLDGFVVLSVWPEAVALVLYNAALFVAGVALAFPALALLVVCPLVFKAFADLYLHR